MRCGARVLPQRQEPLRQATCNDCRLPPIRVRLEPHERPLSEFSAGDEGDGRRAGDLPLSKMPEKVVKGICGLGTSCKRYTCLQRSGSDTGGCKVSEDSGREYVQRQTGLAFRWYWNLVRRSS